MALQLLSDILRRLALRSKEFSVKYQLRENVLYKFFGVIIFILRLDKFAQFVYLIKQSAYISTVFLYTNSLPLSRT